MTTDGGGWIRLPQRGRLVGCSIFLSASVPHPDRDERYHAIPEAQVEIEDAVVALARAVFAEGGRLVFGGHPSIAPLVALVAGEYLSALRLEQREPSGSDVGTWPADPPLVIHQLEAYRTDLPDATSFMEAQGHAKIMWAPMDESERVAVRSSSRASFPVSLKRMRSTMIDDPSIGAMVAIGGMEGVEEEVGMFLETRSNLPVYVLAKTGGAAAVLAGKGRTHAQRPSRVRIIDEEILDEMRPQLRGPDGELREAPLRYVPYPLIMQVVVQDVGRRPA
jgi:hypothetical protein